MENGQVPTKSQKLFETDSLRKVLEGLVKIAKRSPNHQNSSKRTLYLRFWRVVWRLFETSKIAKWPPNHPIGSKRTLHIGFWRGVWGVLETWKMAKWLPNHKNGSKLILYVGFWRVVWRLLETMGRNGHCI